MVEHSRESRAGWQGVNPYSLLAVCPTTTIASCKVGYELLHYGLAQLTLFQLCGLVNNVKYTKLIGQLVSMNLIGQLVSI